MKNQYLNSLTVSGWGRLESGGWEKPKYMQMVEVIVPTNNVCDKMLPEHLPWDKQTDSMICAGGADKDACQGKDRFEMNLNL